MGAVIRAGMRWPDSGWPSSHPQGTTVLPDVPLPTLSPLVQDPRSQEAPEVRVEKVPRADFTCSLSTCPGPPVPAASALRPPWAGFQDVASGGGGRRDLGLLQRSRAFCPWKVPSIPPCFTACPGAQWTSLFSPGTGQLPSNQVSGQIR